jgi:hypothetical protein
LEKSVTKKLEPEKIKYFCPVDENVNITLDGIKHFKEMRWKPLINSKEEVHLCGS